MHFSIKVEGALPPPHAQSWRGRCPLCPPPFLCLWEEPRQLPRVHASDKNTLRPLPGRPEDPDLVTRQFQIFYTMRMFEQTVESELEDSLGEYETAADRNSRDRRADAVRDVIGDITHMK